ncbi:hypothetical protein [Ancylomarina longa]|uniref:hypothetical protein n=1 Tax=Ancylomarina longa TaxID=2487017 RepID=UPI001ADE347B|nr:hypothetical protein [Ancylomarina longa]
MSDNVVPTKKEYEKAEVRLEELLPITSDDMPLSHPLVKEILKVSDIIEEYERKYYSIV